MDIYTGQMWILMANFGNLTVKLNKSMVFMTLKEWLFPPHWTAQPIAVRYSELKADFIIRTIAELRNRISERFPGSGLSMVAEELYEVAKAEDHLVSHLKLPIGPLRIITVIAIFCLVAIAITIILYSFYNSESSSQGMGDWLQAIESGINEMIFLSLAIYFVSTLEGRIKRRAALRSLHKLRSIAHVVDMHQLTKDPQKIVGNVTRTESSPDRKMTPGELIRYLDYCSEMLALTNKLAALHAQYLNDPVVLAAVNDVQALIQGLTNKIWQKIMLLDKEI